MSGISVYLLSIVGVVFLGVVIDLVMHEGETAKYIKSLFALFIVFVIVSPIPKLIKGDINFASLFTSSSYTVDDNFLNNLKLQRVAKLKQDTENYLETNGFKNTAVDFSLDPNSQEIKLLTVYVDLRKLVLSTQNANINKYTAIRELVAKYLYVEEEKIIFYG